MTVSTTHAFKQYNGNGSATEFAVDFVFLASSELLVTLIDSEGAETVQTISTHYTVSGGVTADGTPATGTVTMLTAPASGEKLRIERITGRVQGTTYASNDAFPAKTVEGAYDKRALIDQELDLKVARALKLSMADYIALGGLEIPAPEAGKAIGWNEDGDGLVNVDPNGVDGAAATVTIGTVTTGDAGTDVEVENVGTPNAAILNFTIPKGDDGAPGAGTGDMLAANNLSDVADKPTAFANIKQAASTTATGVVELATDAEAQAKSDAARALTPSNLAALGASDTFAGLVEKATDSEAQTGTDTARFITPAGLQAVTSTETRKGVVELATTAEAAAGTDTARAVTPAGVAAAISALSSGGKLVDRAYGEYTTNTSSSSTIPIDDTIPQSGEGVQIISVSITPKSTTNRIRARFRGQFYGFDGAASPVAASVVCALFQDSVANALAASIGRTGDAGGYGNFDLEYEYVPATTSAITLKIRVGGDGSTWYLNGANGRKFGGVSRCTLVVEELYAT